MKKVVILDLIREVKKQNKQYGLSPTYLKTPPPPPPNVDYVFFSHHCFIILFQYLDIFFCIKSKNKIASQRKPQAPRRRFLYLTETKI